MIHNKKQKNQRFPIYNFFPKNRKAQGMSTQTVILLILGLIVLAALIWGFFTGFSAFRDVLNPSNVDKVVDNCATSCSLKNQYDYCYGQKSLRASDENFEVKTSCYVLANLDDYSKYRVEKCPQINCDASCADVSIDDVSGDSTLTSGTYDVSSLVSEDKCFIP